MSEKKPYDSTLVRVAGNIAAGIVTTQRLMRSIDVAREAFEMALQIVDQAESYEIWKRKQAEVEAPKIALPTPAFPPNQKFVNDVKVEDR